MRYEGYLLDINGLKLPFVDGVNIFENGAYSFNKERRNFYDWKDITGKIHHEVSTSEHAVITFRIKDRTLEQQLKLANLFKKTENITVTYYDDYLDEYVTGLFFIDGKSQTTGMATKDNIFYKAENITLKEY